MNWVAIAWAGLVASTFATAFFWLARSFKWTRFSPSIELGCFITGDPRRPITETIGFAILFLIGLLAVPALFGAFLGWWSGPPWIGGLVLGGFIGLAGAAALPMLGTISACVRAGLTPPPGPFGIGWGKPTPGIIVAGMMIYGAIVAAVLAGF
jgi:hypothetical protein